MALSPAYYDYFDAEIIINARQTTEVTITTSSTSEVVTVYGNWSLHFDLDYSMRTTLDIEEKGWYWFRILIDSARYFLEGVCIVHT